MQINKLTSVVLATIIGSAATCSFAINRSTTTSTWPEKALVGYVTAYGSSTPPNVTNQMILDSLNHHYNVFVYAFGSINSKNSVSIPSGVISSDLNTQITNIHQAGGLAILSFGGQNNTFLPDTENPTQAADNTIELLKANEFDGIDLDLENISVDNKYLGKRWSMR